MKLKISFILILFILQANTYAIGCTSCNGDEIEITGVLKLEVYPGPPNYEDIADGDTAEKYWFVVLNESVCFSPDNEFLSKQVILTKIQLILDTSKHQVEEGTKYYIKGVTVPAHTGHHHSDVLLNVKSMKEL